MIVYLILLFVFGFLILLAIGLLIFGLITKRKNLWITAIVLFIIGFGGGLFSIVTYTRKAMEYVTSSDFQNDARRSAELAGRTIGSTTSGVTEGLANTLDDEAIKNLASKSATILGKVTKTVASNLDSTLGNKSIFLDETLENSGIVLGRADEEYNAKTNDLGIFIDYKKDFKGNLRITNYDQDGRKIEVVDKPINSKAGSNKAEVFSFQHSALGMTTYYILSKTE